MENIRKNIATRKNMEIYHVNKNENQKKIKEIELFMVNFSTVQTQGKIHQQSFSSSFFFESNKPNMFVTFPRF